MKTHENPVNLKTHDSCVMGVILPLFKVFSEIKIELRGSFISRSALWMRKFEKTVFDENIP